MPSCATQPNSAGAQDDGTYDEEREFASTKKNSELGEKQGDLWRDLRESGRGVEVSGNGKFVTKTGRTGEVGGKGRRGGKEIN